MNPRPIVTDVSIILAADAFAESGLMAWSSLTVNGLAIGGVAVRRTSSGKLQVTLPTRKAGNGALHPIVTAADPTVELAITTAVLREYFDARSRAGRRDR